MSPLGYCENCGSAIMPVWYRDGKETVLSHGECPGCFSNICVEQMTRNEYDAMARGQRR